MPVWRSLYKLLMLPSHPAPSMSLKHLEKTPDKKSESIGIVIDLDTPPAAPPDKTELPSRIGQSRGAYGKPKPASSVLLRAGADPASLEPSNQEADASVGVKVKKEKVENEEAEEKIDGTGQRSSHIRSCRKRVKSPSDVFAEQCDGYLQSIGFRCNEFVSCHARTAATRGVKGTGICCGGGYAKVRAHLRQGIIPTQCEACKLQLRRCKFDLAAMRCAGNAREDFVDKDMEQEVPKLEDDLDMFSYVKKFSPIIRLLEPEALGEGFSFQCTVCKTRRQPQGKISQIVGSKAANIKYYIDSHIGGQTHQQKMNAHLEAQSQTKDEAECKKDPTLKEDPDAVQERVPCEAISTGDPSAQLLHTHKGECELWAKFAKLDFSIATQKHAYELRMNGDLIIRSGSCEKMCTSRPGEQRQICRCCLSVVAGRSVLKKVIDFALSYWLALILHARLFLPKADVNEHMSDLKLTMLHQRYKEQVDKYLAVTNVELQGKVRSHFGSLPAKYMSPEMRRLVSTVIRPVMRVNVEGCTPELSSLVAQFSRYLATGRATELQEVNIKIASSAISGDLDKHPFVQGLAVAIVHKIDREARGCEGVKGPKKSANSTEIKLIADSGATLALATKDKTLARTCGTSASAGKIDFDKLHSMGFLAEFSFLVFRK